MRDQLRDMIAAKMHAVDCGCPDWTPDAPDVHTPDATDFYRQLADSVMELFPDEITESWMVRGVDPGFGDEPWTTYPKSAARALSAAQAAEAKGGTAQAFRVFELRTFQPLSAGDPS